MPHRVEVVGCLAGIWHYFAIEIKYTNKAQSSIITLLTIIIKLCEEFELLQNTIPDIIKPTAKMADSVLILADLLLLSRDTPKIVPRVRNNETPPMTDIRVLLSILFPHAYNP